MINRQQNVWGIMGLVAIAFALAICMNVCASCTSSATSQPTIQDTKLFSPTENVLSTAVGDPSATEGPFTPSTSVFSKVSLDTWGWQGIVPGETTVEDALNILKGSPYVQEESIRVSGFTSQTEDGLPIQSIYWISSSWSPPPQGSGPQHVLRIVGGKVVAIKVRLDDERYLEFSITAEQALSYFGAPEKVMLEVLDDEYDFMAPTDHTVIHLLYPSHGFALRCQGTPEGSLFPDSVVTHAYYFEPVLKGKPSSTGWQLFFTYSVDQAKAWEGFESTP